MTISDKGSKRRAIDVLRDSAPDGSTGIYTTSDGILYGYLDTDRSTNPRNYIWFRPLPLRYTEPILATRTGGNADTVTLVMNTRQAHVLLQVSRRVSGEQKGPRGTLDELGKALRNADLPLTGGDGLSFGDYRMDISSDRHDA